LYPDGKWKIIEPMSDKFPPAPLLAVVLAPDGVFETSDIWSIMHRQQGGFDLVIIDQNGGKTAVAAAMARAALKTETATAENSVGKIINALVAQRENPIVVITSDRVCPTHDHWLKRLCDPLLRGVAEACGGREIPAPGGNYFIIENLRTRFPRTGAPTADCFSMDNCAVKRDTVLRAPFPEGRANDAAAAWMLAYRIDAAYCTEALVMRQTLLPVGEVYRQSKLKGEDMAVYGKVPGFIGALADAARGLAHDIRFAFSIKKPQFLWYPFLYRPALHFGFYAGGRRGSR